MSGKKQENTSLKEEKPVKTGKKKSEKKTADGTKKPAKKAKAVFEWQDVTDFFDEDQRYYKDTYLEIDEVMGKATEVSLFSREDGPWEIYVSYGIMYGIVYADPKEARDVREKIKADIMADYDGTEDLSDEFIRQFVKKYDLRLPPDTLFSMDFLDGLFGE